MKARMLQRFLAAIFVLSALLTAPTGLGAAENQETLPWPRQLDGELGQIVIYQPQFEEYSGDALKARAAVSVTPKDETEPAFGAIWFDARLATDTEARTVSLESITVTDARFPDSTEEEVRFLSGYLEDEVPKWEMVLSMDRLVAGLEPIEDSVDGVSGLNNEPPKIIHETEPTVLVTIDGEPILEDLEEADLKYVVNTPYYVLKDPEVGRYYLRGGGHWYAADDIHEEWSVASSLPPSFSAIASKIELEERQRTEAEAADLWTADPALSLADEAPPKVIVSTTPAEVIETDGEPMFAPIEGTDLLYLQNSESDIILDIRTQRYFILLAGRWYVSDSLSDGSWTHVPPDRVPADFFRIPTDSDMASVRASVAGTDEAAEAVAENLIPQTAEVDRHTASVRVTYDGDPEFVWCSDEVAYAVNTDKAVLFVDDAYYCCDDAVWFVSDYPDGPWLVATWVPEEIRDIPPSCPVYNVRYVYIYDSTPDVVYVGYTPAYLGSYIYRGCVVYGTGYWYRPWYRRHYYPRFATWGYGAHWRPYTGWGLYFGVSFGWLDLWLGRPWYTGWWGPSGYVYGYRHGYHHGYYHGYHDGYWDGYHEGYWDSHYAGYYPEHHEGIVVSGGRNLFTRREKGIRRAGIDRENFVSAQSRSPQLASGEGGLRKPRPVEHVATTLATTEQKDRLARQAREPDKPRGNVTIVRPPKSRSRQPRVAEPKVKKPKAAPRANDVYVAPDGKVYQEKEGRWEKLEKRRRVSPGPSKPPKRTERVLNKERRARNRGEALERQAKPKKPPKTSEASPSKPAAPKESKRPAPRRPERRPPPRPSKGGGKE